MKILNKRKINSKTIDNNYISTYKKPKSKYSKSQKTLDLIPRYLYNNLNYPLESGKLNNSLSTSDNYQTGKGNNNLIYHILI